MFVCSVGVGIPAVMMISANAPFAKNAAAPAKIVIVELEAVRPNAVPVAGTEPILRRSVVAFDCCSSTRFHVPVLPNPLLAEVFDPPCSKSTTLGEPCPSKVQCPTLSRSRSLTANALYLATEHLQ